MKVFGVEVQPSEAEKERVLDVPAIVMTEASGDASRNTSDATSSKTGGSERTSVKGVLAAGTSQDPQATSLQGRDSTSARSTSRASAGCGSRRVAEAVA